jgi:hypothetical protein
MFPNIRVMIAALLASISGISCGLGALAAFRVNHQPFTRMQSANPPLQLAFGTGLPEEVTDARPAPFDVRFQIISRPSIQSAIPAPSNVPQPAAAATDAKPEGEQQARLENMPQPAASAHQDDHADIAPVGTPVPEAVLEPVPAQLLASVPAPVAAVDHAAPAEAAAPESKPATAEASPIDTVTVAKAENTAAVEPSMAPIASAEKADTAKPNPSAVTAASAAKAASRHVVKLHHRRKPQAAGATSVANQNFASPISQPQWQGSAQETPPTAGQTPLKHVIAKRLRPARKAASAAGAKQTATSEVAVKAAGR